jgi:hypothetical protein
MAGDGKSENPLETGLTLLLSLYAGSLRLYQGSGFLCFSSFHKPKKPTETSRNLEIDLPFY